jgi:hypothetical protein
VIVIKCLLNDCAHPTSAVESLVLELDQCFAETLSILHRVSASATDSIEDEQVTLVRVERDSKKDTFYLFTLERKGLD